MNSIYEVRQFLQKHGAFIYTGDREADLDLFEIELKQLYEWNMIDGKTLQQGLLVIRKEIAEYKKIKQD